MTDAANVIRVGTSFSGGNQQTVSSKEMSAASTNELIQPTLAYSDVSSSISSQSFPSDASCSDDMSTDGDVESGEFIVESSSPSNSSEFTEVRSSLVPEHYLVRLSEISLHNVHPGYLPCMHVK